MAAPRDWMFCPNTGYMLTMDPGAGAAVCSVSGFRRDLSGGGASQGPPDGGAWHMRG
jgi:hypothetical protein